MRKLLVSAAAIGVLAMAGVMQSGTPAQACAGAAAGETAFGEQNPAFGESGRGSWSLGGGGTDTPRFGEGGGIVVGSSEAGANADDSAPLEPRDGDNTFVTIQDSCPD